MDDLDNLRDDWTVCNCCDCGRILLGDLMKGLFKTQRYQKYTDHPPFVAGRITEGLRSKPYCLECLLAEKHRRRIKAAPRPTYGGNC